MIKRQALTRFAPVLLLALLPLALPAQAQPSGWSAWLFDSASGQMTGVGESGQLEAFILPLPPGFDRYPRRVAAGRGGGGLFAYIAHNSQTFQGALVVSDRAALRNSFNLPLTFSDSFEFETSEQVFSPDNGALAFGYSLEGGGWAVIVYDTLAASVTHILRHDSPLLAVLGLEGGFGLTPVVRRFDGQDVAFTLIQAGTAAPPSSDSYTWNIASDRLTSSAGWPSLDADTLPETGDVVMSLFDPRLPANPAFPLRQFNTLHVYEGRSGARYPFYAAPDESLTMPRFVQNGEYILVNAESLTAGNVWRLIARDGTLVGTLPSAVQISDARGLPDGFVYLTGAFNPGAMTLVLVNTRGGVNAGAPVWTSRPGADLTLAWAGGSGRASAYTDWALLAEPVYAPGALPVPAAAPTPSSLISPGQVIVGTPYLTIGLVVGGSALVNTTEGDQLNVRAAPSTEAQILGRLPAGTRVSLLEGPRFAGGYSWWRVQAGAITGWVVESVPEGGGRLQTLLPG